MPNPLPPNPTERNSAGGLTPYLSEDTIAALATPVGGAIACIRLSGPRAFEVIAEMVSKSGRGRWRPEHLQHRQAELLDLENDSRALGDAVVLPFLKPRSLTGEDLVEIFVYGGGVVVSGVLEALFALGVRQAQPGEFSFRAVQNGKMTLSQAQALPDVIGAASEGALGLALEKLSGAQARWAEEFSEKLRQLAALTEVGIDFSDQDQDRVEALDLGRMKETVSELIEELQKTEASFDRGKRLQEGVSVAIIGLPNAGKSSFFNTLLGEDRSIVTDVAGTTRDLIRESLTLQGEKASVAFRVEDTAGLRKSAGNDLVEAIGIERSREAAARADLVLFCVDGTASDFETALELWKSLDVTPSRAIGVMTKSDLSSEIEESQFGVFGLGHFYKTSAMTGEGMKTVAAAMVERAHSWVDRPAGEIWLTRLDHLGAVRGAIESLERARGADAHELLAADLRQALACLAPIIGETPTEDLLERVFSGFCIGK